MLHPSKGIVLSQSRYLHWSLTCEIPKLSISMISVLILTLFFYLPLSEVVLALGDIAALCVILIRPKWRGSASAASKVGTKNLPFSLSL